MPALYEMLVSVKASEDRRIRFARRLWQPHHFQTLAAEHRAIGKFCTIPDYHVMALTPASRQTLQAHG